MCSASLAGEIKFSKKQLQILSADGKKHEFTVEVADTKEKREHGLMFRKKMPENNGMLFLFDKDQEVNMWMKDTDIPLDIVFIKSGEIWKIAANTIPFSLDTISSRGKVSQVLELNAGICEKLGISEKDKISY